MKVEWDPDKNEENIRKHHIDFEDAMLVFADPNRLERYDLSAHNDLGEDRWQTLGLVDGVLFVCYTERQDAIRMISARKADSKERRIYYSHGYEGSGDWPETY